MNEIKTIKIQDSEYPEALKKIKDAQKFCITAANCQQKMSVVSRLLELDTPPIRTANSP
jgi:predicted Rossmann fold nucleotide-binding protein DprA/Smf involved in DNA uptake